MINKVSYLASLLDITTMRCNSSSPCILHYELYNHLPLLLLFNYLPVEMWSCVESVDPIPMMASVCKSNVG